jgi:drug/metabolite transporter (DMT)-like permease
MIKLFVLMFLQLFLITLSSRFANRGQWVYQFFISFFIGILWVTVFKDLLSLLDDPLAIYSYALGSACGGVAGILVHKRFLSTKKESKEW